MEDILAPYRKLAKNKLEWGKLATFVPNKRERVYNWFYYKEGFARELVLKLLAQMKITRGQWVLDPFCGSGTTLLTCKEKGVNAIGIDTLPISVFASFVKSRDFDAESLADFAEELFEERYYPVQHKYPPLIQKGFHKDSLNDLSFYLDRVKKIANSETQGFFLLALISAGIKSSYLWKDGGVVKIKKRRMAPFKIMYKRVVKNMIKDVKKTSFKNVETIVDYGDARHLEIEGQMDGIITSPPYLNNIDYTKVYEVENHFLGQPDPSLRSYIGQHGGKEKMLKSLDLPKPAHAYFKDMSDVLENIFEVLKPGKHAAIVVGNAYFTQDQIHVESDLILSYLADQIGFKIKNIFALNKRFALENRTVKKGVLRESLLLFEKPLK